MTVTFRLVITGQVPAAATFAVEDGLNGGARHAIYLCSGVYDGYPVCTSGGTYDDVWTGPPGTQLTYRFWRERDVNDAEGEEIEAGEFTVGPTDQVILATYAF